MCQCDRGGRDLAESADYWRTRCRDGEATLSRLSARLRRRDQRILLPEQTLAHTVALHHGLEDSLDQWLMACSGMVEGRCDMESVGTFRGKGLAFVSIGPPVFPHRVDIGYGLTCMLDLER